MRIFKKILMKFMKNYIIIIAFFLFVTSCVENKSYKNVNNKLAKNSSIQISKEDIHIPIDSMTYPSYSIYQNVFVNDMSYLAGYNRDMHSIDVFDLNKKEFFKHIKLDNQGPNGIRGLNGFYIHNWDSIFVRGARKLHLMDSVGLVKHSINLPKYEKEVNGTLTTGLGFRLYYSETRNSVFYKYVPRDVKFGSKEYFSKPFIAELNLTSHTMSLLPVRYSKYIMNNFIGYLFRPYVSFYNNIIYYCFTGESNIYSYDLKTQTKNTYGGRSKYSKDLAQPISRNSKFEEKSKHRLKNVQFFNVIYDPYRELFYRLHFGNLEDKISEDINKAFNDKSLYLMIFNKDFELIREIELEDHTYRPQFYGISGEGLFLNANHEMNENFSGDFSNFKLFKIHYSQKP